MNLEKILETSIFIKAPQWKQAADTRPVCMDPAAPCFIEKPTGFIRPAPESQIRQNLSLPQTRKESDVDGSRKEAEKESDPNAVSNIPNISQHLTRSTAYPLSFRYFTSRANVAESQLT